jgi:hypothetical protein
MNDKLMLFNDRMAFSLIVGFQYFVVEDLSVVWMEAVVYSGMLVPFFQSTVRHILGDCS